MGMSVAASSAIIFTGFLIVATVMITTINSTVLGIQDELRHEQDRQSEKARTVLHFDNATKNSTAVFINVTNSGSSSLAVKDLQVLVNGTLVTNKITKHSVAGSTTTDLWAPAEGLYLEINLKAKSGMRVTVCTGNGVTSTGVLT